MDIVGHSSPAYGMGSNCGDLIFSGHTAGAFVWLYCIIKELNKKCISLYIIVQIFGWLIGIPYLSLLIICLLACRRHYTIDVVMGLFIGIFTYNIKY